MNHTKEEFLVVVAKLPKDLAFWIKEDYKSINEFLKSGMISETFAESEWTRLFEEASKLEKELSHE